MDSNTTQNESFSLVDVLLFAKKHFVLLASVTFIGALASVIVAFAIPVKFKSSVIFFPAPSATVSKVLLSDNFSTKTVSVFGEEEEAEQFLQVLYSDVIRERIVSKYNLMKHYEIEGKSAFPYTELSKLFYENVNFRRTEYMSIQIDVLDTDPQIAADMANDVANLADTVLIAMEKERAIKALEIVGNAYSQKVGYLHMLEDSLNRVADNRTLNMSSKSRMSPDVAMPSGKNAGAIIKLQYLLEYETEQLSLLKARYDEAKVNATSELPHKYTINKAHPAEKKSTPVRWIIVVFSTMASFVFALLLILAIDTTKKAFYNE